MSAARVALLAIAAAGAVSCRTPEPRADVIVVPVSASRPAGPLPVVFAEVVATPAARERGLMGRGRLAPDHGMLFVYPSSKPRTFWMKDCVIGLDIAFLAEDGRVEGLATLGPGAGLDLSDVPKAGTDRPCRYVLETEAGWFARHRLGAGARVDVTAAAAGVVAE